MVNKMLMTAYQFHSPMFLTSFHFFLTWLLLEFLCRIGFIRRGTNVTKFDRWLIGAIGIIAVIFQNLNLMYNSIGFYQLSKLCSIPFMVLYNLVVEQKTTPLNICFSLVILLIGVGMFTVNDVTVNLFGSVMAAIAIVSGSLTQLFTKSFQVKYAINGPTLQHQTALPSCICCIAASCFFETHGSNSIFTNNYSFGTISYIIASGILAIGTNTCAFGLIGKTNAITFQVVGHLKTILIFTLGFAIFRGENESKAAIQKMITGLSIAMFGVILYTVFEIYNNSKKEKEEVKRIQDTDSLNNSDTTFVSAASIVESDEDENEIIE